MWVLVLWNNENLPTVPRLDKCFRFPLAIIGYAVWLYFRFSLSYRDGADYEAVYWHPAGLPRQP